MKLSTTLNYAGDMKAAADEAVALERVGLDCLWVAEAYSFDAVTMLGYLAARTDQVEIGSAILNVYSRTPALIAMTFAGLDAISKGRANCGLGASGPQVVEGFHGVAYAHPTKKISETIEVCRMVWRRELVEFHGATIDIPLPAGQGTGLGKPLKLVNHPVRETIPIWWASLKPKSVEATARMAEGWIPIFYIPELATRVWGDSLARGRAQRDPELGPLQILAGGRVRITEDAQEIQATLDAGRPQAALYIGGMGARGKNFYNDILVAYGWEKEAKEIQELYLEGKRDEAARKVPSGFLEATALVGPAGHVAERLAAYKQSGVSHLQLQLKGPLDSRIRTLELLREMADST
jgi:F420-dependent oxidoreductase-like protein